MTKPIPLSQKKRFLDGKDAETLALLTTLGIETVQQLAATLAFNQQLLDMNPYRPAYYGGMPGINAVESMVTKWAAGVQGAGTFDAFLASFLAFAHKNPGIVQVRNVFHVHPSGGRKVSVEGQGPQ